MISFSLAFECEGMSMKHDMNFKYICMICNVGAAAAPIDWGG